MSDSSNYLEQQSFIYTDLNIDEMTTEKKSVFHISGTMTIFY